MDDLPLPNNGGTGRLRTEHLSAFYGSKKVLDDVSLSFPERMATAIIGPSGCGKSTFIRCLNRIHETTPKAHVEGKVLLDGADIYAQDATSIRRRIGMVFQRPNPFPTMTIYENVSSGLRLNGVQDAEGRPLHAQAAREEIHRRVIRSLQQAALYDEVKDQLRAPGTRLSGGQQQRLCIARALAVQPEILLMDEPASALDPVATSKIEDLIFDLKKEYTVVIVTHSIQQASRIADRTAFLYLGKLIETGETRQVFERPKEKLTESYITGRFG